MCEYHNQTNNNQSIYLINKFGYLNAAHETLPPYTQIKVTYENKSIIVTINDLIPKTSGILLELSNMAAEKLNIIHEGFMPCIIESVKNTKNYRIMISVFKFVLYFLPISMIIMVTFL